MTASRRMAFQYVLMFASTGVSLPFAGLWLRSEGLSGAEIGVLLSAPMLGRIVTGPLLAVWADGFRRRRSSIAILAGAAAFAYGLAGLAEPLWLRAPLWFVAATAMAAIIPLTDVLTLRLAGREGFAFSVPRGCGSAAFVLANVAMGGVLARAPADAVIVWLVVVGALLTVWSALAAPPEPVDEAEQAPRGRERFAGLARLLADPGFMTAAAAVGLIQATHGFYYAFSALAWRAQGLGAEAAGALWAFAVAVEIAFMWIVEPWRRRRGVGPVTILAVGAAAGVARWTALAFAPPLWLLWPLQALHALTFAATYLAGVELVQRLSPPAHHTAAQTINSALASGLLIGLATLASGPLYDRLGTGGYLAMAAMALVGGLFTLGLPRRLDDPNRRASA